MNSQPASLLVYIVKFSGCVTISSSSYIQSVDLQLVWLDSWTAPFFLKFLDAASKTSFKNSLCQQDQHHCWNYVLAHIFRKIWMACLRISLGVSGIPIFANLMILLTRLHSWASFIIELRPKRLIIFPLLAIIASSPGKNRRVITIYLPKMSSLFLFSIKEFVVFVTFLAILSILSIAINMSSCFFFYLFSPFLMVLLMGL